MDAIFKMHQETPKEAKQKMKPSSDTTARSEMGGGGDPLIKTNVNIIDLIYTQNTKLVRRYLKNCA